MCESPISIYNKSVYKHPVLSARSYSVPCGTCESCRSSQSRDWYSRLVLELFDVHRRGGKAVFLTFTYNNENLPKWSVPFSDDVVPCFSRSDVNSFLKSLKTTIWRLYGKNSYKYFFVSEYGSTTRRPHYHGLFFLEDKVDYITFVETCRRLWSVAAGNGFMFPKSVKTKNGVHYVDNKGNPSRVLVENSASACSYTSKYVCKDLDFYNIPSISHYLNNYYKQDCYYYKNGVKMCRYDVKKSIDEHLPKHWQSSGLGKFLLEYDIKDLINYVEHGITNPFNPFEKLQLPSYIVNNLMYNNVKSSRVSVVTGRNLYDRYLSDFGRLYFPKVYISRRKRFSTKVDALLTSSNLINLLNYADFDFSSIVNRVRDSFGSTPWIPALSNYHYVLRNYSLIQLIYFTKEYCDGDIFKLFSDDFCSFLYCKSKDLSFIKNLPVFYSSYKIDSSYVKILRAIDELHNAVTSLFLIMSKFSSDEEISRFREVVNRRRRLVYSYDKNLC